MPEKLLTHLFDAEPPRNRRDEIIAAITSVIGHLVVLALLLFVGGTVARSAATDLGAGDGIGAGVAGGGGGGGNDDTPVAFTPVEPEPPAPPNPPVEPVQVPVPVPIPEIKPIEPQVLAMPIVDSLPRPIVTVIAGNGAGTGTGTGSGIGAGTGAGSGGGRGGGDGGGIGSGTGPGTGRGRLLAPAPEVLLIPPPAPGSVRGKTVVVRLAVDSAGIVRDAEIFPSTGDKKYDAALKRVALGWRFRPARDTANRAVETLFEVTFTF